MKFANKLIVKNKIKRVFIRFTSALMLVSIFSTGIKVYAEDEGDSTEESVIVTKQGDTDEIDTSINVGYMPVINEVIDSSGFKHPGIGLTKDILENARTQILAKKDPWYTYYNETLKSWSASKTIQTSNASGGDFNSQGYEARFIKDALASYTQAILYYITGDEVYRKNALNIIRIWEKSDPKGYKYYNDAHIHTGIPLNRMVSAAEILRYTSCKSDDLKWTDKDTTDFTNNLITPVIETFQNKNSYFMNQHLYPLLGAMAGYIFTGNRERYNEGVEWYTINKTAIDQGQNGAIKQLFRLVDTNDLTGEKVAEPMVEHVEMGRDQSHGSGDLVNVEYLARELMAQGTKVDPVNGTVSTAANAVGPYEFLDNRILKATDYYWRFMMGYDTPWIPTASHTDANGNPTVVYKQLSSDAKGRGDRYKSWELYYYYKYVKGMNIEDIAPYYAEAYTKACPYDISVWEQVDGGGDGWLYTPKEASDEAKKNMKEQLPDGLIEVDEHYAALDNNTIRKQDGDISYVQTKATPEGSKISFFALPALDAAFATKYPKAGIKFRTNGTAKLELKVDANSDPYCTLNLPNTGGRWRYIAFDSSVIKSGVFTMYMNIIGNSTIVDIDNIDYKDYAQITAPVFNNDGNSDLNLAAYTGAEKPITFDFSANEPNVLVHPAYYIDNAPEGATIDAGTGAFSWKPTQTGTYSFVVTATNGTIVSTKNVKINVTNDRKSALQTAITSYDGNKSYESDTLDNYNKAYKEVTDVIDKNKSDEDFYRALLNLRKAVNGLRLLTPLLEDGSIDYPKVSKASFTDDASCLVDNNSTTFVAYTKAVDSSYIFDFGLNYKVSVKEFGLQNRASFPERVDGIQVLGSNDYTNWTTLTSDFAQKIDVMQKLEVDDQYKSSKFRYIKVKMVRPHSTVGIELSEIRMFGQRYETGNNPFESVSIYSAFPCSGRINYGNFIKLAFKTKDEINNVKVKIADKDVVAESDDNMNWLAKIPVPKELPVGDVKFSINYKMKDGTDGQEMTQTTDSSKLTVPDFTGLITDITKITDVTTSSEDPSKILNLFDHNTGTFSEFRVNGSGSGAWITFDFKEGNKVSLSKVNMISRQDTNYTRIAGTVIQGSDDNKKWTTISNNSAVSTMDWQTLNIKNNEGYRYIRVYNSGGWYANIGELELYGDIASSIK